MSEQSMTGYQVANLSMILQNSFHLNCHIFAPTRELLDQAVGQVLLQVHFFMGDIGFGTVIEDTDQDLDFKIEEVNDPKVNRKLVYNLPEGCMLKDDSKFVGRLD